MEPMPAVGDYEHAYVMASSACTAPLQETLTHRRAGCLLLVDRAARANKKFCWALSTLI